MPLQSVVQGLRRWSAGFGRKPAWREWCVPCWPAAQFQKLASPPTFKSEIPKSGQGDRTPLPNFQQVLQAIVTVLAVINPVMCGSIFLTLTLKLPTAQRRRTAIKVSFSILLILLVSALVGLKVLSIFNISLDVFRVVGA